MTNSGLTFDKFSCQFRAKRTFFSVGVSLKPQTGAFAPLRLPFAAAPHIWPFPVSSPLSQTNKILTQVILKGYVCMQCTFNINIQEIISSLSKVVMNNVGKERNGRKDPNSVTQMTRCSLSVFNQYDHLCERVKRQLSENIVEKTRTIHLRKS